MEATDRQSPSPVVKGLGIWVATMGLSWLAFIHSDSGPPVWAIWVTGALVGLFLLILGKGEWAAAWLIGTALAVLGFMLIAVVIATTWSS
jgi:hypothetical protein